MIYCYMLCPISSVAYSLIKRCSLVLVTDEDVPVWIQQSQKAALATRATTRAGTDA